MHHFSAAYNIDEIINLTHKVDISTSLIVLFVRIYLLIAGMYCCSELQMFAHDYIVGLTTHKQQRS